MESTTHRRAALRRDGVRRAVCRRREQAVSARKPREHVRPVQNAGAVVPGPRNAGMRVIFICSALSAARTDRAHLGSRAGFPSPSILFAVGAYRRTRSYRIWALRGDTIACCTNESCTAMSRKCAAGATRHEHLGCTNALRRVLHRLRDRRNVGVSSCRVSGCKRHSIMACRPRATVQKLR